MSANRHLQLVGLRSCHWTNPALMRLRELEVLEKVADKANLSVVLGEKGLADRIMKLL